MGQRAAMGMAVTMVVGAASCNLVLGLGSYKDCPQEVDCPATNGGGGAGPSCSTPSECPQGSECETSTCVGGKCGLVAVQDGTTCGGPGEACAAGVCACPAENQCAGGCADTQTDAMHCGGCGKACPVGTVCLGGTCGTCPTGMPDICSGACVDKATDANNCGMCGNTCATGATCAASTCSCPMGEEVCAGACVNTGTDVSNCGMCGKACTATGAVCNGGTCGCPTGQSECGGACIDTTSDPKNCGSCERDCLGAACQGGLCQPEVLATGQAQPTDIAVNATHVYWDNTVLGGTIMRLPVTGGSPTTVATATSQQRPVNLALNVSNVYWTLQSGNVSSGITSTIMRAPLGSTTPTQMTVIAAAPFKPGVVALAATPTFLYWIDLNAGRIDRMPAGGGGTSTAFNPTGGFNAKTLAVANDLYALFADGSSAYKATIGTSSSAIFAGSAGAATIAADDSSLYWTAPGSVAKGTFTGGGATVLAMTQAASLTAIDAAYVYYVDNSMIWKVPISGGAPKALATSSAAGIAVDGTHIYWTVPSAGTIYRVSK